LSADFCRASGTVPGGSKVAPRATQMGLVMA
jgi:hypothetical protein